MKRRASARGGKADETGRLGEAGAGYDIPGGVPNGGR
jgi:hypothetical protein